MTIQIHNCAYYFQDPSIQSIPCWDKDELERIYEARGERGGYYAEQEYYNNDIHKYTSIIIYDVTDERFEYVKSRYRIVPAERFFSNSKWYLKFTFGKGVSHTVYEKYGTILGMLYAGSFSFYRPSEFTDYDIMSQPRGILGALDEVDEAYKDVFSPIIRDPKNHDNIAKANEIDPHIIIDRIGDTTTEYDEQLGIIIGFGSNFTYVKRCMKSMNGAYRFFNGNFNIGFITEEESVDTFMSDGVITSFDSVYQKGLSLCYDTSSGPVTLTDFVIYVHYRLIRGADKTYIVTIAGANDKVRHVEWKNFSSDQQVAGFVQGLGSFHITNVKGVYKKLHEFISTARVPNINVVDKFGKVEYKGRNLIVYADSIVDIETNKVYEKYENSDIYFIEGLEGIRVESAPGILLQEDLGPKTPYLGVLDASKKFDDFLSFFQKIYRDESAYMLLGTLCTWMGHILFSPKGLDAPIFFVYGPSGSGKTVYSKILSRVFGIEQPLSLEGTTAFPIRKGLTKMDGLPFFMSEFRTRMAGVYEKTQILKALFDGTPFERGRKDLTTDKAELSAAGFIEGEELPESGATRSRLVIHALKASGQNAKINPEIEIEENESLLKSFQYTYIMNAKRDEYMNAFKEAPEVFDSITSPSARIRKNIFIVYAGMMAFGSHRKDEIVKFLMGIYTKQIDDYKKNSTGMEVIKIAGRYLQSKWAKYHIVGFDIILPWQELVEYVHRSRQVTELALESYKPNLEGMGFKFGFFEVAEHNEFDTVNRRMIYVEGMKISCELLPDDFKCNKDIFNTWKEYEKNKIRTK